MEQHDSVEKLVRLEEGYLTWKGKVKFMIKDDSVWRRTVFVTRLFMTIAIFCLLGSAVYLCWQAYRIELIEREEPNSLSQLLTDANRGFDDVKFDRFEPPSTETEVPSTTSPSESSNEHLYDYEENETAARNESVIRASEEDHEGAEGTSIGSPIEAENLLNSENDEATTESRVTELNSPIVTEPESESPGETSTEDTSNTERNHMAVDSAADLEREKNSEDFDPISWKIHMEIRDGYPSKPLFGKNCKVYRLDIHDILMWDRAVWECDPEDDDTVVVPAPTDPFDFSESDEIDSKSESDPRWDAVSNDTIYNITSTESETGNEHSTDHNDEDPSRKDTPVESQHETAGPADIYDDYYYDDYYAETASSVEDEKIEDNDRSTSTSGIIREYEMPQGTYEDFSSEMNEHHENPRTFSDTPINGMNSRNDTSVGNAEEQDSEDQREESTEDTQPDDEQNNTRTISLNLTSESVDDDSNRSQNSEESPGSLPEGKNLYDQTSLTSAEKNPMAVGNDYVSIQRCGLCVLPLLKKYYTEMEALSASQEQILEDMAKKYDDETEYDDRPLETTRFIIWDPVILSSPLDDLYSDESIPIFGFGKEKRSIALPRKHEASANSLIVEQKPAHILRDAIRRQEAFIQRRMEQSSGPVNRVLESKFNDFHDKMQVLSAYIDRLQERYVQLNRLEDDYVSGEFPSDTIQTE